MNTSIYCFYPASYGQDADGNALMYNVFNGTSWQGEAQVPLTNTYGTPGSIAYNEEIWCFHEGNLGNGELWYNIFDGTSWLGDQQLQASPLSAGPSACMFYDQLFCFYSGGQGGNMLLYNVFNGESWLGEKQVPLTNTSQAPSAVMYEGLLYCFHQGNLNNGELWYNVFDGTNWLGDQQIPTSVLSSGPSACVYEGRLYCFYPGTYGQDVDGNALLYTVFDGTGWSAEAQVPSTNISCNPSAVTLNGKLYCFHQGNLNNGELWYNVFDGTSWEGDLQVPASPLSWGPGATSDLRNEIQRMLLELKNTVVVVKEGAPLPSPESLSFVCPPDSQYNWDNYVPQSGWGFTGVVNWQECQGQNGTIPAGSLFIFPGCRLTEQQAEKRGITAYQGKAQINGQPAQANYRLPQSGNTLAFTLHWQLCEMLMPEGEDLNTYVLNFLGFSYSAKTLIPGYNSGSLNGPYFERVKTTDPSVVLVENAATLSSEWQQAIGASLDAYFKK